MTKQIALVTGGMGGLGEAISVRLHDAGYRVVVTHSPNKAGVRDWLDRMAAQGRMFPAYAVDVANYESCQACVAKIQAEVGPIDILVNNAGITRDASFKKLDKESWDAVIRTNLDSVFNMSKPVCEGMVERGWGRIINISSIIGSKGGFGQTNYAAAKAGMHGFTKSLALEVAKRGVTVNTVLPGYIATKMVVAVPQEILDTKIIPQDPGGSPRSTGGGGRARGVPVLTRGWFHDRREPCHQWRPAHAVSGLPWTRAASPVTPSFVPTGGE